MSNDSDKPESGAGEAKPPKTKAEENPWYLLATLYGVPGNSSDERWGRNRRDWNRYFAVKLDDKTCARLIAEKRHTEEELTPFSPGELKDIETAFALRCKHLAEKPMLPKSQWPINFADVHFDEGVTFEGYVFKHCNFNGAVFSLGRGANFNNATFTERNSFIKAVFSSGAYFRGASFPPDKIAVSPDTNFGVATFHGAGQFRGCYFRWQGLLQGHDFLG